jgi:putative DNA primase/helicase
MGDYAREIAAETLMEANGERHPTEMCEFFGARLVVGSEVDAGKRWNESRIKRLTGGDRIAARYCGKDFFNFDPSHTLIVMGNNKPGLRQVDEAIRRRLHLVHFGVTISEAECDATVPERLRAEFGGILQWALEGALKWQQSGLCPPESVRAATAAYLAGEDQIESWIDECCERRGQVALKSAFTSYRAWAEKSGSPVLGKTQFRDQLEARAFGRSIHPRTKSPVFSGLSLPVGGDWRDDE